MFTIISQSHHPNTLLPLIATMKSFNFIKVVLFLWLSCIFLLADAHPGEGKDGSASPTSAPGKLLQLALKKTEEIKHEKEVYKETHKLKVQKEKGSRHDRAWAQQKKSDKDRQE